VSTPDGDARLGSFLSTKADALEAVQEAVAAIRAGQGDGFEPELALVFAAAAYGSGLEEVVPALRQLVPSLRHIFGCTVSWGAAALVDCEARNQLILGVGGGARTI
jgi:deleted-in-malignant-brain-tumors protein 1